MPWVKVEPSIKVKNPFYIPMIPFLQKWLPKPGVQIVDLTNYDDTKDVKTNSEVSVLIRIIAIYSLEPK